jgi:predicted O-methyltransferase YrrM
MDKYKEIDKYLISQIKGVFSPADMEALEVGLKRLVAGNVYVEVGVQFGRSMYTAVTLAPNGVKFFAIDKIDHGANPDSLSRKEFFKKSGIEDKVVFINIPSPEAADGWQPKIDMLFLDGDHSYEGVKADVDAWGKFLKTDGFIFFHDASHICPDVKKLLYELAESDEYDGLVFYRGLIGKETSIASLHKKGN